MNPLRERYGQEIDEILAKYPQEQKRSAVMPLLYVAQREHGYVTREHLGQIGELLSIAPTEVASIVGFYTLYHDTPGGKYRLQVCNDLPCALRGADKFLDGVCDHLGVKPGETTEDGVVTVEAVMCLAACDKAPMFQVQSREGISYHENQTVESTIALVDGWRKEEK
ncbi:MAG: NAD(P)H-dependent oxidoreductase subunit E [Anaerolineales bacterium]|nr:MAG: NAD(P)H-dependent oxidoreductase subunit E [Anaerolineales bacterium]